jgi:hypothetical protein
MVERMDLYEEGKPRGAAPMVLEDILEALQQKEQRLRGVAGHEITEELMQLLNESGSNLGEGEGAGGMTLEGAIRASMGLPAEPELEEDYDDAVTTIGGRAESTWRRRLDTRGVYPSKTSNKPDPIASRLMDRVTCSDTRPKQHSAHASAWRRRPCADSN